MRELKVQIPDEFLFMWESEEDAMEEVRKLFVLALVANKKISQGRGAELLDISRYDFMDLMANYNIPTIDIKPEDLGKGVGNLRRAL